MGMPHDVEDVWKKNSLYDELKGEWDMHSAGDLVMCLGDINGHIGRYIDGGHGVGQINFEEIMLLEYYQQKKLCMSKTWCR